MFGALEYVYGEDDAEGREAEWIGRAQRFVDEPRNWHAIEVFARELLALERIDGQVAASLLDFADGEIDAAAWGKIRHRIASAR